MHHCSQECGYTVNIPTHFVLRQRLSDNNQKQGNSEKLGHYVQQIS
jgi:hypothetical protein